MADTKITALTAIGANPINVATFPIPMVDLLDNSMAASGTTKKVTVNQLLGAGGTATLASATITGDLNVSGNGAFTGTGYVALQRALNPVGENGVTSLDFRWYSTGTTYTTGARVYSSSDAAWTASSTPARLMFSTVPSGSTSLSERYRIDNAGIHTWQNVGGVAGTAMTLNSTGLGVGVTPSAGKGCLQLSSGINFPATQVASSDANTLDDYVETTFSPTIVGSTVAGTATYTTQIGRATKIGRLVTFSIRVAYSAGTGIGNLRVGNLPFAAGAGSIFAVYAENIALTAGNYPVCGISSGNTFISIDQLPTGGGAATSVPYDAAGDIQISGSYIV